MQSKFQTQAQQPYRHPTVIKIGVVGNPNCGKTTLFNLLTGTQQRVGNWPGVTVEQKTGKFQLQEYQIELVDLPGIYSLSTSSLDEKIARDYILSCQPDLIINIVDSVHLERNLYLTVQLLELNVPCLIVLNMMDRVKQKRLSIDKKLLSLMLKCPVVEVVARRHQGMNKLKDLIYAQIQRRHLSLPLAGGNDADRQAQAGDSKKALKISYPQEVEEGIAKISDQLRAEINLPNQKLRWLALKLIEGDVDPKWWSISPSVRKQVSQINHHIRSILREDSDIIIADSRYGFIHAVCQRVVDRTNVIRRSVSNAIDKVVLNKYLGLPIFVFAMYITFWITINLGGCFIDFFDILFGSLLVDGVRQGLTLLALPQILITLIADGLGGGLQTVATFIPPILFMFLMLSLLEDSGYMARAAFIMDRLMRLIGLPGKAFVALMIGFGCNVPAIMSTRTLENHNDRVLTILMNPFMSCGARLPVYGLFVAAFFPGSGGLIVFSLYMIGILMAVGTGYLLKSVFFQGEPSFFIMELPPYHIPTFRGVAVHTWSRLQSFILKAGKAIIVVVILLNILNAVAVGPAQERQSLLTVTGKSLVPIFKPMGISERNWPAVVGLFTGIFAKETVIGTLDNLYATLEQQPAAIEPQRHFDLWGAAQDAVRSIRQNFSAVSLPFAFAAAKLTDADKVIETLDVSESTYASLRRYFNGSAGAFAYLLFILLYMPCAATIAAVYKELNLKWTIFAVCYYTMVSWMSATLFYQAANIGDQALTSIFWIVSILTGLVFFVFFIKKYGRRWLAVA